MPKHIVRRMVADQFETQDDRIVPYTSFADVDATTLLKYRQMFRGHQGKHPFAEETDEQFLWDIGAYGHDNERDVDGLTQAGLLMFGNLRKILHEVPEYNVDYREYSPLMSGPQDRWIDRDTTDFTWPGNLFSFFLRVTPKLYAPIKIPFRLGPNQQRIDETLAHTAIREAMVNTLVHADYDGRMGIVICRWQDHIEFRNPGLLRLSKELAVKGWSSDCRNKTLQKMFQFLGYSEKAGSGFPKIFMGTDEQHWERPTLREDFQLDQTYLTMPTVDLTEDSFQPEGGVKGGVKTTPITTPITTPKAIMELIRGDSRMSAAQMAQSLGLTRDGIRYHLDRMKAEGVIRFVGSTRNGHWELVQKPFQTTIANERSEPKVD